MTVCQQLNVVVVMPCMNEERYIRTALNSLLLGTYPKHLMEIWVLDGGSVDLTLSIVEEIAATDSRVLLWNNPGGNKSRALNFAAANSSADVLLRADCHARYQENYVYALINILRSSGAQNVGAKRSFAYCSSAKSRALAWTLGEGMSALGTWRGGSEAIQEATTTFGGCFWRSDIERFGWFDERLVRVQDREFNSRILAGGGQILQTNETGVEYYPREFPVGHLRWIMVGARWLIRAQKISGRKLTTFRNYGPGVILIFYALLVAFWLMFGSRTIALILLVCFAITLGILLIDAVRCLRRIRDAKVAAWTLPVSVLTFTVYGIGILVELIVSKLGWREQ